MCFRPLKKITARWINLECGGQEHLTLEKHANRITATAVVTAETKSGPVGAWYQLFYDSNWRIKAVSLHLTDSRWFIARSRRPGEWADGDGRRLDHLSGCTDVDLPVSPFTNTAAIRRLGLEETGSTEIDVVLLPFDTLEPHIVRQRYCCLEPARRYAYMNLASGFEAEIETDHDGLVLEYPGLFKRLS